MNSYSLVFVCLMVVGVAASPKKYGADEGGFTPSHRYYESNLPSDPLSFNLTNQQKQADSKISKDERPRFGIPLSPQYGSTANGGLQYGNNGVGYMISPMKIDIGGIALGALIGLGAILVVPKIAQAFSGGYGYRSLENDMTNVLARIDNSLEQHNIDSSTCMQRIICTYVNDAQKNLKNGEANTVDQFIVEMTNNTLFSFMLDGSAIKQAVEMGKSGDADKCTSLYEKCPVTKENILKVIASLLPA